MSDKVIDIPIELREKGYVAIEEPSKHNDGIFLVPNEGVGPLPGQLEDKRPKFKIVPGRGLKTKDSVSVKPEVMSPNLPIKRVPTGK